MAQREVWQKPVTDTEGNILVGASVTVFEQDGSTLATIYTGLTGGVKANPFLTNTDGLARFYADPGRYVVRAQKGAFTAENIDVDLSMKALREDLADENSDVLIAGVIASLYRRQLNTSEKTVRVPSDYPTISAAIQSESKFDNRRSDIIVILLESGYEIANSAAVRDGDFGRFWIRSEDAFVNCTASLTGSVIFGERARMPVLDCLIDMNGFGTNGYDARGGSVGFVNEDAGCINAGGEACLRVESSIVSAANTLWTGGANRGVLCRSGFAYVFGADASDSTLIGMRADQGGIISAQFGKANNCDTILQAHSSGRIEARHFTGDGCTGTSAVRADSFGFISVRGTGPNSSFKNANNDVLVAFQNGQIYAGDGCECDGAGRSAVRVESGGKVIAPDIIAPNCGGDTVFCDGGEVDVTDGDLSNSGGSAIRNDKGRVISTRANMTGATAHGIITRYASASVTADNADVSDCNNGIEAIDGARVSFESGTANNINSVAVYSNRNGDISMQSATITNAGVFGLRSRGGRIYAHGATITGSVTRDIEGDRGTSIVATGVTTTNGSGSPDIGDTNFSQFNSFDGSKGVVFA